ncbi:UNVERIFIED_CONTAM: hypothetical protein GTU68_028795 [Idotea baltica]|nr:hypothetical protein [Idotea baltica]
MVRRICLLLFLLLVIASKNASGFETPQQPNIIFVMADDLGFGDLGCYGSKQIQTPNIDRMASEGIRFTQCYAGSPVCAPSRSVLMTGLHTGHTRVRGNFGVGQIAGVRSDQVRVPLLDEDVTLAEVLRDAGYATGITGKWGLGEPGSTGIPTKQGFEEWFGYLNQRRAHSHYPDYLWLGTSKFPLVGNSGGKQQQYSHDLFTGFALNFVRAKHKEPFFLYLPYCVPHNHFEIPDLGPYADKPWSEQEKTYAAMVSRLDGHMGQLMDLLVELKIDSHTIIFFCSDNGAANRYDGVLDSSGLLRGRKRDMYEGGIRTPMVVRWPDRIQQGSTSELVWSFADVLPTLAELANASFPANLDGVSIAPALEGQMQDLKDRLLYWEFHEKGFQQAVRWQNWKAVRMAADQPLELYDLAQDVGETTNIALQHPDVISKIEDYLKTARTKSLEFPVRKAVVD